MKVPTQTQIRYWKLMRPAMVRASRYHGKQKAREHRKTNPTSPRFAELLMEWRRWENRFDHPVTDGWRR